MRNTSFLLIAAVIALLEPAAAQQAPPASSAGASSAQLTQKMNAYVGCINRLSARSYESRDRYFSWAAKSGPTGKERIIYGTYTIYDTSDCKTSVAAANAAEPHDAGLEAAANAYVAAVTTLEPLDRFYPAEQYHQDFVQRNQNHPYVRQWALPKVDKVRTKFSEHLRNRVGAE